MTAMPGFAFSCAVAIIFAIAMYALAVRVARRATVI